MLAVAAGVALSLAKPWLVGRALNALTGELSRSSLRTSVLLLVAVAAAEAVFLFLQRKIVIGTSREIEFELRNDFYAHLQSVHPRTLARRRTGDLVSRAVNDIGAVRLLVGPMVLHSLTSILVVAGALIMMWRIDRSLATIAAAAVPAIAWIVHRYSRRIQDAYGEVQATQGAISTRVHQNVTGVRVIRAYVRERKEIEALDALDREYLKRNHRAIRLNATLFPLLRLATGLITGAVFLIGGQRVVAGTLSVGAFVALQFYVLQMIWPLVRIGWVLGIIQRSLSALRRLDQLWLVPAEEEHDREVPAPVRAGPASVEIRGLTYVADGRTILDDLSLCVEPGRTVGIVGATGSGKSTLLALLSNADTAPPGTILIDGKPLESILPAELRELVAVVPQETFVFSSSVSDNIRFGRPSATLEETEAAAVEAGLAHDLESGALRMDAVAGERGVTLSGGQRQRIAIARAFLRKPPLLLLDDAFSASDAVTEDSIVRVLEAQRGRRTTIVASHRVSSVRSADTIVVLDRGRIVESGTHGELIARGGVYATYDRLQRLERELESA